MQQCVVKHCAPLMTMQRSFCTCAKSHANLSAMVISLTQLKKTRTSFSMAAWVLSANFWTARAWSLSKLMRRWTKFNISLQYFDHAFARAKANSTPLSKRSRTWSICSLGKESEKSKSLKWPSNEFQEWLGCFFGYHKKATQSLACCFQHVLTKTMHDSGKFNNHQRRKQTGNFCPLSFLSCKNLR